MINNFNNNVPATELSKINTYEITPLKVTM